MNTIDTSPGPKTKLINSIILLTAGTAVNFLLSVLAHTLGLPLYLDSIGTIAVSAIGGFIPGICIGIITNMINCINDPASVYYAIISILIAVAAVVFNKKKPLSFRSPLHLLFLTLTLAFIGGGIGTFIPWLIDGLEFDNNTISEKLTEIGMSLPSAQLTGNLIMDILDKAVSVILSVSIISLIPDRIKEKLHYSAWKQHPLTNEQTRTINKMQCRTLSLRTKIMLAFSSSLILLAAFATGISYVLFRDATISQHIKFVSGITTIMTDIVNGDDVDRFISEGHSAEGYDETEKKLELLLKSDDDIEYIYVYRIENDGCHVVFDIDTSEQAGAEPGDIIPFDSSFASYIPTLLAGGEIEPIITDDTYGHLLTVYKPIFDSSGKCVCYAAADVQMQNISAYGRNFLTSMVLVFLAFFLVVSIIVLYSIEYSFVLPLNAISYTSEKFAYDSDESIHMSMRKMEELKISTGDEIENLYHAVVKTESDVVKQLEDILKKSETINKMQEAFILVLADMVENRDKSTGDHIKKTASYVRIVLNRMKASGYDISDEYIDNVVASAPLHDIGKIKIPDTILGKPGRLTDSEFDIMKTHTRVGRDIIQKVMELVPESDKLDEALSISHYHHEKWNGKG
ncbi:MAG: HD domain-containing protein, partial [Oscillospiraceae bacterium]|nr:HD domain-containing protein [Oscillospiraceae bacterium]